MTSNTGRQPRQSELDFDDSNVVLPSPKRVASATIARKNLPWEGNYAAYSIQFATEAVRQLTERGKLSVFDPFVGNGTTLDAASRMGVAASGIELNPYSALLARCRVAVSAERAVVRRILRDVANRAAVRLSGDCLNAAISSILDRIGRKIGSSRISAVASLCEESGDRIDSEIVALVSLLHTQRMRAHVHFRSNPAWLVRGDYPGKPLEEDPELWISAALGATESMLADLDLRAALKRQRYKVFARDFRQVHLRAGSIKRFLTSPPYLNRLDYVNPTLPALEGLGFGSAEHVEALRQRMMGTAKMRAVAAVPAFASATANDFIEAVTKHPSKASGTYYRRFFCQYFVDLDEFFIWLSRVATPDVFGMIVLQDSYYKEIKIPLSEIAIEMAQSKGFNVEVMASETHSRHMGRINPHQSAYVPEKSLTEFVLGVRINKK
jgi:hypothetical protein